MEIEFLQNLFNIAQALEGIGAIVTKDYNNNVCVAATSDRHYNIEESSIKSIILPGIWGDAEEILRKYDAFIVYEDEICFCELSHDGYQKLFSIPIPKLFNKFYNF